jgi:hypothetical protein
MVVRWAESLKRRRGTSGWARLGCRDEFISLFVSSIF